MDKLLLSKVLSFCCALFILFAPYFALSAETASQNGSRQLAKIEAVKVHGDGDTAELVIKLSKPVAYTSYKTKAPLRVVLDLSQATEGVMATPQVFTTGNFKTVTASRYDTDAGVLTRVDIEIVNDGEPHITASPDKPGEIKISFAPMKAKPETQLEQQISQLPLPEAKSDSKLQPAAVKPFVAENSSPHTLTRVVAKNGNIILDLKGGVPVYKTARYHKPERYLIDLIDTKNGAGTTVTFEPFGGGVATIGTLPDKVRIIFEPAAGYFPNDIEAVADGETIILSSKTATTEEVAVKKTTDSGESESSLKLTATRTGDGTKKSTDEPPENLPPYNLPTPTKSSYSSSTIPSVEMIDFQVLDGFSRILIKTAGGAKVEQPTKGVGFVSVLIKNATLPNNLQRSLETVAFASPVLRVTPIQLKTRSGNDSLIRISLRVDVPFSFKHEGDMSYVDFQNPAGGFILSANKLSQSSARATTPPNLITSPQSTPYKNYQGRKVSLDFDNAEIRHVFRLLADVSEKNFIVGDDVKGNISIKLANVPWEQALDIILDTSSLVMRENGNVITIMSKEKNKAKTREDLELQEQLLKTQKEKVKLEDLETAVFSINYSDVTSVVSQLNARKTERGSITQDLRTNKVIATDTHQALESMKNLVKLLDVPEKQVMIEARIVEASATFTRSLGVNWGIHYRDGSAALLGINQLDSSFGGLATTTAPLTGVSGSSGASAGISFGTLTSNVQLDLRLNAAASAGLVKIVSAPKVSTLNNKTAKITQGQQVPYTSSTSDKVETKFVEAALSLEVTPHINANGTIGMKIDAKNDSVGQATGGSTAPAINKKQATTEMLLRDGETTVIGGIFVDSDNETDEGVPFLMDIPYLGKIFRSNNKTKIKTELLIFITPRILEDV